jgi:hypothetical protein
MKVLKNLTILYIFGDLLELRIESSKKKILIKIFFWNLATETKKH